MCVQDELVPLACYNSSRRIPLLRVLLEHIDKVPMNNDVLTVALQDMFEDVCLKKNPGEDWNGRVDVLQKLLDSKGIKIDLAVKDGSEQSLFGRAVMAGEVEILELIKRNLKSLDVNETLPDDSTHLIRAVFMDQPESVKWLLGQPGIDANKQTPNGTALEIARMKGNPAVIQMLTKTR
eukprot:NODE_6093_length_880_cov_90.059445_g5863_i0.p1 GENE.NODE_6093_length_880_cov_90.059445_g5863_i0~~NODE_6093_length_880_cov_90.059445_g5863_i0.p1  ORF type:complete len:179 (-),score=29.75 NODE_6093_length_880_cov_90.059445_g5863_i0:99-635(-)